MKYKEREIADYVYALLDENRELEEEKMEYCEPGARLDGLISALLPQAAREVLLSSPAEKIDSCTTLNDISAPEITYGAETSPQGYTTARARLPEDFLRILYCRMSDWEDGIGTALEYGSAAQSLRARKESHYRACCRSPAMTVRSRGKASELLLYGTVRGSRIEDLRYVAKPEIVNKEIELPPGLYDDICKRLAEKIKQIIY